MKRLTLFSVFIASLFTPHLTTDLQEDNQSTRRKLVSGLEGSVVATNKTSRAPDAPVQVQVRLINGGDEPIQDIEAFTMVEGAKVQADMFTTFGSAFSGHLETGDALDLHTTLPAADVSTLTVNAAGQRDLVLSLG